MNNEKYSQIIKIRRSPTLILPHGRKLGAGSQRKNSWDETIELWHYKTSMIR